MELNKISSFKSFSEMRNQETAVKTEQENKVKRVKSLEKISTILDELEISDMSELDEEKRKALYSKLFNEDRDEEIADDINTSRVVVSRLLKVLENEGKIKIRRNRIIIDKI